MYENKFVSSVFLITFDGLGMDMDRDLLVGYILHVTKKTTQKSNEQNRVLETGILKS